MQNEERNALTKENFLKENGFEEMLTLTFNVNDFGYLVPESFDSDIEVMNLLRNLVDNLETFKDKLKDELSNSIKIKLEGVD